MESSLTSRPLICDFATFRHTFFVKKNRTSSFLRNWLNSSPYDAEIVSAYCRSPMEKTRPWKEQEFRSDCGAQFNASHLSFSAFVGIGEIGQILIYLLSSFFTLL